MRLENFLSYAVVLSIIVVTAPFAACSIETSTRSVTEATLRRVTTILDNCSAGATSETTYRSPAECLSNYAEKNEIPLEALIRDAYGQLLVLEKSEKCATILFCGPYSTGENRLDDCGRADDLVLASCRAGW